VPGSTRVGEVDRSAGNHVSTDPLGYVDRRRIVFIRKTGRTPATEVTGVLIPSTEEEL